jgi:hypothetical protein
MSSQENRAVYSKASFRKRSIVKEAESMKKALGGRPHR